LRGFLYVSVRRVNAWVNTMQPFLAASYGRGAMGGVGGQIFMPLAETFFAVRFGQLRDRFGVSWMVLAPRPETA